MRNVVPNMHNWRTVLAQSNSVTLVLNEIRDMPISFLTNNQLLLQCSVGEDQNLITRFFSLFIRPSNVSETYIVFFLFFYLLVGSHVRLPIERQGIWLIWNLRSNKSPGFVVPIKESNFSCCFSFSIIVMINNSKIKIWLIIFWTCLIVFPYNNKQVTRSLVL